MPNRIIKEAIHDSEDVNRMTDFEFRLWVNLIAYVDDYGRGDARPAIIKGKCFPLREVSVQKIAAALRGLAEIGSIVLYEAGGKSLLYFPTWETHQRIQTKKSKYPAPPSSTVSHRESPPESESNPNPIQSESEVESESESNPKEDSTISDEMVCCTRNDVQRVVEAWNALGLKQITRIVPTTQRGEWLRKRIRDYGIEDVLRAIGNIRDSQFLMGENKKGWQITFDWFIRPNNFPKVLEGNYADKAADKSTGNVFLQLAEERACDI